MFFFFFLSFLWAVGLLCKFFFFFFFFFYVGVSSVDAYNYQNNLPGGKKHKHSLISLKSSLYELSYIYFKFVHYR